MFLSQNFQTKAAFSYYLLGSFVVIIFNFIGQLPLMLAASYFNTGPVASSDIMEIFSGIPKNTLLFLMLLPFAISLLGLWLVVVKLHEQSFRSIISSRTKVDWRRVGFVFLLWGAMICGFTVVDYFMSPEDYEWNFKLLPFLVMFAVGIIMFPLQTTFEELLFRGYLLQGFARLTKNVWLPLVLTSVLFGSLHFFNPEVDKLGNWLLLYYIGTGLFLGLITIYDQGTELALGFHAANNFFSSILVTASWTVFETHAILTDTSEPQMDFEVFLPLLVFFPLLFFIFGKRYNWTFSLQPLFKKLK